MQNLENYLWLRLGEGKSKAEAQPTLNNRKGMIEMRKYYTNYRKDCSPSTIHKTYHTSIGALTKMIDTTHGNIGKPQKIDKVDNYQKTFSQIWAKLRSKKISSEGATP